MESLIERLEFRKEMDAESERSVTLGDALDMKANVWLVVITFLSAQSVYFIEKGLSHWLYIGQFSAICLLILAGILTLASLCPMNYLLFTPSNGAMEKRVSQLLEYYAEQDHASDLVLGQITKDQIGWAKERIENNQKLNQTKSLLLEWSFRFTAIAGLINLFTLFGFAKLPS